MTIIQADYIYIDNEFKENLAVAFDEEIQAIDSLEKLETKFAEAEIIPKEANSVLYPGFINTHVHLEFSKNKTTLEYGSFMPWLDSVIQNRDDLINSCDNEVMLNACHEMLRSGVTTFGAISSFGMELEVCQKTPQKVVFFNELIGSQAATADMLYGDFLERLEASKKAKPYGIIPAIAIHSPYSVHPILLQRALSIAKQESLPVSAHFLESQAEREWLEKGSGEFLPFFKKFFSTETPVSNITEFMHSFDQIPTHFTHAVQATQEEIAYLNKKGHSIAHCPRSNRLLGCGRLKLEELIKHNMPFSTATDGLSSNTTLNIFDELRAALMLHEGISLQELANSLLQSITINPANILSLNSGEIAIGKEADLVLIELPNKPSSLESIALQTILHTQEVTQTYISGRAV